MAEFDLLVRGGKVVTGLEQFEADIGIHDGRVVALGEALGSGYQEVDARGLLVLPGGVDSHVHLDQPIPGAEMCDGFASGTASAAAGGTTTVICFAWQEIGQSLAEATSEYHRKAQQALVDYAFHLAITDPTAKVLKDELPGLVASGNRSIKIFMTYDLVRLTDAQILTVLAEARRNGALVCVHAEHHDLLMWLTEQLVEAGLTTPKYHAWSKPMVAEREGVSRIIAMAEAVDVPIQVFHVSGAESAAEVARAQSRGLKVWAETCPHYLTLTADDLDREGFEGAKFVFGPPARTPADHDALWDNIRRGVIDIISSDHAAFRFDDPKGKKVAGDNAPFHKIPNGIPGLAARLPVFFTEGVSKGRIDLQTFVRLVSTNPAKRYGLFPRKGTIAVGSDADFVIFDPDKAVTLTNELMHHASDYTPYEGYQARGFPVATYVRGTLVFDGDEVVGRPGHGQFLARAFYPAIKPTGRFVAPFNPVDRTEITPTGSSKR